MNNDRETDVNKQIKTSIIECAIYALLIISLAFTVLYYSLTAPQGLF